MPIFKGRRRPSNQDDINSLKRHLIICMFFASACALTAIIGYMTLWVVWVSILSLVVWFFPIALTVVAFYMQNSLLICTLALFSTLYGVFSFVIAIVCLVQSKGSALLAYSLVYLIASMLYFAVVWDAQTLHKKFLKRTSPHEIVVAAYPVAPAPMMIPQQQFVQGYPAPQYPGPQYPAATPNIQPIVVNSQFENFNPSAPPNAPASFVRPYGTY